MNPPNATKGRAMLAEWKVEHAADHTLCAGNGDPYCRWCDLLWPCPTACLIAAVEEALANLDPLDVDYREDAILAKLEAPEPSRGE